VEHEDGVIAVHAPYFHALERPLRRRLGALDKPLVVALPAGSTVEQAQDRREQLLQMLRQAVGYEITFGQEGGGQ
jgi:vacuolar-type H+-ATPase subunit F/Vma7